MPANILHIFTDQMRADCIAALGSHSFLRTPNLDRLCREGTAFTNAFSPSPVCVPARASMIFGRNPAETGCYNNGYTPTLGDDQTFMEHLRRGGYRTHGIGKCHFTPIASALRGFQHRETSEELFPDPAEDDYALWLRSEGYPHLSEIHGVRSEMYYIPQIAQMPASHHPTQWVGDRTVNFLRKNPSRPWYLFASFIHPHPPLAPPTPWHKLYRAVDMPSPHLPPRFKDLQSYINKVQNRYKYRDRGWDLNLIRCLRTAYFACISFIDFQVGRIIATLEESGQLDNTLIVFTSDHGEMLGDYGCFGKRSMHDASARIPMVVRYPDWFSPGTRCNRPASLIDLAPLFLETAGQNIPSSFSGVSLKDLFLANSSREFVFSQFELGEKALYMAVSARHKYVYSAADQREYVFDRVADPAESHNLASSEEQRATVDALRELMQIYLGQQREHSNLDASTSTRWKKRSVLTIPSDPDAGLIIQDPEWADFSITGYASAAGR